MSKPPSMGKQPALRGGSLGKMKAPSVKMAARKTASSVTTRGRKPAMPKVARAQQLPGGPAQPQQQQGGTNNTAYWAGILPGQMNQ